VQPGQIRFDKFHPFKNENMKHIFLAVIILIFLAACTKESACTEMNGTIQWGGEQASDGLGWYFESTEFTTPVKLKDLPASYQVDDLEISACLVKTAEKFQCFCATPLDVYRIKSIKKL
jgi:hypothetical protein